MDLIWFKNGEFMTRDDTSFDLEFSEPDNQPRTAKISPFISDSTPSSHGLVRREEIQEDNNYLDEE
jgi:hypothetical protein